MMFSPVCRWLFPLCVLLVCSIVPTAQAVDANGFGSCAGYQPPPRSPESTNTPRLAQWLNDNRGGHGWNLVRNASNGKDWLFWYTHDADNKPIWLLAEQGAGQSFTLYRYRESGTPERSVVGSVEVTPNPGGYANRLEVQWTLNANAIGNNQAQTRTECLVDFDSWNTAPGTPVQPPPGPTEPFAGLWTIPGAARSFYAPTFIRRLHRDMRPDQIQYADSEIEFTVLMAYDNGGTPRWLTHNDGTGPNGDVASTAIFPQVQAKHRPLYWHKNGYCAWCAKPQGYSVAGDQVGHLWRRFISTTRGHLCVQVNTQNVVVPAINPAMTLSLGADCPNQPSSEWAISPTQPAIHREGWSQFADGQEEAAPSPRVIHGTPRGSGFRPRGDDGG